MNWNELVSLRISELVVQQIQKDERFRLKQSETETRKSIELVVKENFAQEKALTQEVYKMMEDLENQGHRFERRKMFPLLKAKLAKKKGFIL